MTERTVCASVDVADVIEGCVEEKGVESYSRFVNIGEGTLVAGCLIVETGCLYHVYGRFEIDAEGSEQGDLPRVRRVNFVWAVHYIEVEGAAERTIQRDDEIPGSKQRKRA